MNNLLWLNILIGPDSWSLCPELLCGCSSCCLATSQWWLPNVTVDLCLISAILFECSSLTDQKLASNDSAVSDDAKFRILPSAWLSRESLTLKWFVFFISGSWWNKHTMCWLVYFRGAVMCILSLQYNLRLDCDMSAVSIFSSNSERQRTGVLFL